MTDSLTWLRAAQRVLADVAQITVVHGVTPPTSGTGASSALRPASDLPADDPAIVMGWGGATVVMGPVPRLTCTLSCAVWRNRQYVEQAYDGLAGDVRRIVAALAPRGKAYAISAEVQSLLPTSFGAIDGVEWPAQSNSWYLVLPFELEMVVDVDVALAPN